MNVVQLEHLTKTYVKTGKPAVSDLSLSIPEGAVFGLLGPNGAGKSTTVMILCGLTRPDQGKVTVMGLDVNARANEVRRQIGVAPQEIALFPTLTARENLNYFGRMYGLSSQHLKARIDQYLTTFGLTEKAGKQVHTFSGGMKRRLNLIAALLHDPRLVILDEPTAGVDVQSRNMILAFLEQLKKSGTSIIYSSHVLEEAERICTHIAVVDEGQLVASGTREAVMQLHPECSNLENLFLKLTGKNIRD
ncbi:MAG TPA: ABC transporter ATP-binding protein [Chryseolinea sp.]|nr:ABC transporter ATP-binding protein [Chryseolinea sp.]